ncbi:hypothetical protein, partial [Salmonella enterica]
PAWIGALSLIDDTMAGRAGTCILLLSRRAATENEPPTLFI